MKKPAQIRMFLMNAQNTKIHIKATMAKIHMKVTTMKSHKKATMMTIHVTVTTMEIHAKATIMKTQMKAIATLPCSSINSERFSACMCRHFWVSQEKTSTECWK